MKSGKVHLLLPYIVSIIVVLISSSICFYFATFLGYQTVALILLMTVSVIAMIFDILPVLISAILSALIWNFLFIPPIFTFHIGRTEDTLMFFMYFLIALVNAVLTFKIRQTEKRLREKEEKEKTINLYNTLLNSLSHELRTPISMIISAVDNFRVLNPRNNEALHIELLMQIEDSSLRLNRHVENLLNMSRLESGILKLKEDWCDLNEVVSTEIHKFQPNEVQCINFEFKENLPLFLVDAGFMQQILHNLLHNAITHTKTGTLIFINIVDKPNLLILEVKDLGEGFTQAEKEKVFDKFYKRNASVSQGLGLGLPIVKGYVQAMGGIIEIIQEAGKGACFRLSIPVQTSYLKNLKNE